MIFSFESWICFMYFSTGNTSGMLSFRSARYNSFNWEYLVEDRIVDIPMMGKYGSFSITSKISNAFWVLFLFCAKMAFNAWFKGKDRCIGIKYSPFIVWKDSGNVAEREIASSMENGDKNGHL